MRKFKWCYMLSVFILLLLLITASCITITTSGGPTSEESQSKDSTSSGQMPESSAAIPAINFFLANPENITSGDSSLLSWNVSNADSVSINHRIGTVPLGGKESVSPTITTTYILTASNSSGSITASIQVNVAGSPLPSPSPPPPGPTPAPSVDILPDIHFFLANPVSITYGSSSMLSWQVANTNSVSIDHGIGSVAPGGNKSVSPTVTTTYVLTASNAQGMNTKTAQITVKPAQAIIPPSLTPVTPATPIIPGSITPVGEPDLIIHDVYWGESGKIWFKMENGGTVDSGPFRATLHVDDVHRGNMDIYNVRSGWVVRFVFMDWTIQNVDRNQMRRVLVTLDPDNMVDETDEGNNSWHHRVDFNFQRD